MRRLIPVAVIAAVLLLLFIAFRSFHSDPATVAAGASAGHAAGGHGGPGGPGGEMPPTLVETARAQLTNLPNQFETIGTLRAQESIVVRPEVAGRIDRIGFSDGQKVAAGAPLFALDSALTRADLNEANANLQNTTRAYARATELAGRQLIARADVDTKQAELAVNRARVASARTRLDKTQIRAPFTGVTGLRKVSVGDFVNAGQELVDLVRLDPIEIDMHAPETVLATLAVGQKVQFGVDTFPGETFTATVVAIAPTVDVGGRSVSLRARLENADQKLRPGMSARVRITLSTNAQALMVPEQAIWPNGEQKNVYVVDKGVAHLVPVTLGERQPGTVQVLSGLKAGDQVVTAGQLKIQDGAKVAVKPMAPPAPPAETGAP